MEAPLGAADFVNRPSREKITKGWDVPIQDSEPDEVNLTFFYLQPGVPG